MNNYTKPKDSELIEMGYFMGQRLFLEVPDTITLKELNELRSIFKDYLYLRKEEN